MKYCTGSADGMDSALGAGALGVDCAVGEGRMCTGSGLFLGWEVEFWGSSISFVPLPSSVSSEEVSSFCCLHCSSSVVSIRHSSFGLTSSW